MPVLPIAFFSLFVFFDYVYTPAGDNRKCLVGSSGLLVCRYKGGVAALKIVLSCVDASRVATGLRINPDGSWGLGLLGGGYTSLWGTGCTGDPGGMGGRTVARTDRAVPPRTAWWRGIRTFG